VSREMGCCRRRRAQEVAAELPGRDGRRKFLG